MVDACVTGWAAIGQEIGREPMQDISNRFGLVGGDPVRTDNALRGDLKPTKLSPSAAHAAVGTAMELTPLQVAHLFATIANNGSRIQPRLVEQVRAHDGSVIHNFEPNVLNQSISKETAAKLLGLLSENVKTGTAQGLALSDVQVAGMSASRFSGSNHLWMVALAPVTRPEVVVAVLLEGDGSDDQETAEANIAAITRRITEAVLRLSNSNLRGS
jgi:peptidoglycan glycosyltransferase